MERGSASMIQPRDAIITKPIKPPIPTPDSKKVPNQMPALEMYHTKPIVVAASAYVTSPGQVTNKSAVGQSTSTPILGPIVDLESKRAGVCFHSASESNLVPDRAVLGHRLIQPRLQPSNASPNSSLSLISNSTHQRVITDPLATPSSNLPPSSSLSRMHTSLAQDLGTTRTESSSMQKSGPAQNTDRRHGNASPAPTDKETLSTTDVRPSSDTTPRVELRTADKVTFDSSMSARMSEQVMEKGKSLPEGLSMESLLCINDEPLSEAEIERLISMEMARYNKEHGLTTKPRRRAGPRTPRKPRARPETSQQSKENCEADLPANTEKHSGFKPHIQENKAVEKSLVTDAQEQIRRKKKASASTNLVDQPRPIATPDLHDLEAQVVTSIDQGVMEAPIREKLDTIPQTKLRSMRRKGMGEQPKWRASGRIHRRARLWNRDQRRFRTIAKHADTLDDVLDVNMHIDCQAANVCQVNGDSARPCCHKHTAGSNMAFVDALIWLKEALGRSLEDQGSKKRDSYAQPEIPKACERKSMEIEMDLDQKSSPKETSKLAPKALLENNASDRAASLMQDSIHVLRRLGSPCKRAKPADASIVLDDSLRQKSRPATSADRTANTHGISGATSKQHGLDLSGNQNSEDCVNEPPIRGTDITHGIRRQQATTSKDENISDVAPGQSMDRKLSVTRTTQFKPKTIRDSTQIGLSHSNSGQISRLPCISPRAPETGPSPEIAPCSRVPPTTGAWHDQTAPKQRIDSYTQDRMDPVIPGPSNLYPAHGPSPHPDQTPYCLAPLAQPHQPMIDNTLQPPYFFSHPHVHGPSSQSHTHPEQVDGYYYLRVPVPAFPHPHPSSWVITSSNTSAFYMMTAAPVLPPPYLYPSPHWASFQAPNVGSAAPLAPLTGGQPQSSPPSGHELAHAQARRGSAPQVDEHTK